MLRPLFAAASAAALLCAGCASYVTPGGPIRLADIDRADVASEAARMPSPHFPARVALVRVQAPQYKSFSSDSYGKGRYSVVTTQELLTDDELQQIAKWPAIEGVTPLSRLLLPDKLDSLDDLRLAAAKLQADIMLIYTVETSFQVQGRAVGPLTAISLGTAPDRDAYVTSTASAVFTDVRTGFTYGTAEATAKTSGLSSAWGEAKVVDKKRLEAEQQAFTQLLAETEKTWDGIAKRYQ
ncbi:hypothetical protein [Hydrocarboniphaga sp.]|uniref:hypothetical protein n=1 Tax=Hydrocarboniphaga sp. TaxID=2033016 RepID=UPI003D10A6D6